MPELSEAETMRRGPVATTLSIESLIALRSPIIDAPAHVIDRLTG